MAQTIRGSPRRFDCGRPWWVAVVGRTGRTLRRRTAEDYRLQSAPTSTSSELIPSRSRNPTHAVDGKVWATSGWRGDPSRKT